MREYLILRLRGPLQSWGDVALDPRRPTRRFPSRSALAGLVASALGWRYEDGERTNRLQDHLDYAVREDEPGTVVVDYQTVDLGAMPDRGWTRWGIEKRGGSATKRTHLLFKEYLADAGLSVALGLVPGAPVSLDDVEDAMRRPARPLFLGRKSCPPIEPLLPPGARRSARSAVQALLDDGADLPGQTRRRYWFSAGSPFDDRGMASEIWDRRDFVANRFEGSRVIVEAWLDPEEGAGEATP